jgi:hypothetical protein
MFPNFLLPRYCKWIGLILYAVGILRALKYTYDLDDVQHPIGLLIQIIVLIGLVLIIGSKLKQEDEMTQHIRLISLQWAILFYIFIRVLYKSLAFYFEDVSLLPKHQVNFLLLVYLVFFYSQVYFIPWIKSKLSKNEE